MIAPRDNPFRAARFAPGALPWIGEIDPLVDRVCVPNARVQVIGPHGSGKTTLLVHLARHARARGWTTHSFRGSRGIEPLALLGRGPLVVFADEAEELGPMRLRVLSAACALRGAALVATAHRDLGMEVLCERGVDPGTVHQLCQRLLDGEAPPPLEVLAKLLRRHRGNVREVFFELYDVVGAG